MWLVQGAFDEANPARLSSRLLKPGVQYPVGRRKPLETVANTNKIFLAEKKASRLLGTFIVDDFPDNLNGDAELHFKLPEKDAACVLRNGVEVEKDAKDTVLLAGGDIIRKGTIVKGTSITILQETMYIYVPSSIDREIAKDFSTRAAQFGIRVTRTWSHIATHYILDRVPEFNEGTPAVYPPELLCGLLSGSNFVTLEWLKALVEKAELPRGQGNLEDLYDPPKVDDNQPEGAQSELWKPMDNRQGLFRNVQFTILYEGSRPKMYFDAVVAAGNGTQKEYDISSDKAADTPEKWSHFIRKARSKKGIDADKESRLALVGLESEVLKAHEDWERVFLDGAQYMDMRIVFEEDVALAVLHADLAYIDCSLDHELPQRTTNAERMPSPSPAHPPTAKFVRSTLEEETLDPSTSGRRSRYSAKAAASAANTAEVKDETQSVAASLLAKPPRRRPRVPTSRSALFGLDDDSIVEDEPQPAKVEAPTDSVRTPAGSMLPPDITAPSQSIPLARPKRRGETQATRNRLSIFGIDEDDDESAPAEPAHKRFKAEFESGLIGGTLADEDVEMDYETGPSSQRGASQSLRPGRRSQSVLSDTNDTATGRQSQSAAASASQRRAGSKRKVLSDVEEDSQAAEASTRSQTGQSKRRAVENVNSVAPAPPSKPRGKTPQAQPLADKRNNSVAPPEQERGAAATGVDTAGTEYLQALASKKKGKRKEDGFDREFNNLRITVPKNGVVVDLEAERARAEEMEVWGEVGKDMDMIGNFMVVIETDDVLRKDGGRKESAPLADTGVPNFKRFKKKGAVNRAPPVEMYAEPIIAYGEGSEYWNDPTVDNIELSSQSQSQSRARPRPRSAAAPARNDSMSASPPAANAAAKKRAARQAIDSDDDIAFAPRAKTTAKAKAKPTAKSARAAKDAPEYYPSDDEPAAAPRAEPAIAVLSDEDEVPVRRAAPARRTRGKAKAVVVEDSDEEDFGAAIAAIGPDVDDSIGDNTLKSSGDPPPPPKAKAKTTRTTRAGAGTAASTRAASVSTRRSASVAPAPSQATSKAAASKAGTKKRTRADSDSDDGVAFKGSGTTQKRTRR